MPTRQRLRLEDELRSAGAHELLAVIRDTQRKGSIAGDGYASLIRKLGLDLLPQDDRFRLLDALRDGTDSQDDTVATALLKVRVLVSKMEEVAQSAGLDCRIRFKDENEIFPTPSASLSVYFDLSHSIWPSPSHLTSSPVLSCRNSLPLPMLPVVIRKR